MKRLWLIMAVVVMAITVNCLADITFEDDFESGNLNNWTLDGSWDVVLSSQNNNYARGLYADNEGSMTHALSGTITGSWAIDFVYDFEYGGSAGANGDPRITLAADLLDDSDNGYSVRVREGSWWDPATYPSLEIYRVTGGVVEASALASGEGYDMPGWRTDGLSSPGWKSVEFSLDSETGLLSATVNGNTITATDTTYSSFTKIEFVAQTLTLGTERVDIDSVSVTGVPEPATLGLMAIGFGLFIKRRKV